MVRAAHGGYRGGTFDLDDLWSLLEDPEVEADLRTAAVRVLVRSGDTETHARIGAAIATVRDEATLRMMRVADIEESDLSSDELEAFDIRKTRSRRKTLAPPGIG